MSHEQSDPSLLSAGTRSVLVPASFHCRMRLRSQHGTVHVAFVGRVSWAGGGLPRRLWSRRGRAPRRARARGTMKRYGHERRLKTCKIS